MILRHGTTGAAAPGRLGVPDHLRLARPRIDERVRPRKKGRVGGHESGGPRGSFCDEPMWHFGADIGQRQVAEIVDGNQVELGRARKGEQKGFS